MQRVTTAVIQRLRQTESEPGDVGSPVTCADYYPTAERSSTASTSGQWGA